MKTRKKECRWLFVGLLVWLAAAPLAQAFYNVEDYKDQRLIGGALARANEESAKLPALNETLLSRILTFATECGSQ